MESASENGTKERQEMKMSKMDKEEKKNLWDSLWSIDFSLERR